MALLSSLTLLSFPQSMVLFLTLALVIQLLSQTDSLLEMGTSILLASFNPLVSVWRKKKMVKHYIHAILIRYVIIIIPKYMDISLNNCITCNTRRVYVKKKYV